MKYYLNIFILANLLFLTIKTAPSYEQFDIEHQRPVNKKKCCSLKKILTGAVILGLGIFTGVFSTMIFYAKKYDHYADNISNKLTKLTDYADKYAEPVSKNLEDLSNDANDLKSQFNDCLNDLESTKQELQKTTSFCETMRQTCIQLCSKCF